MPRLDHRLLGLATLALACASGTGGQSGPPPTSADAAAPSLDTAPPHPGPVPGDASSPTADLATADATADVATEPVRLDGSAVTTDGAPPPPLGPFPLAAVQAAQPQLLAALAAHNEGPVWRDGDVFFAADGLGLMRADAQGKLFRYHPTLQPIGARTLANGTILICEKRYILLQMFRDGTLGVLVEPGGAAVFCNDVTVDAGGNVYFSDSRTRGIMRLTPAGELTRAATSPGTQANGVEVDPANAFLYFSDTGNNTLFRAPVTAGGLGAVERLGPAICDGMAFDAWGNLWMAQVTLGQALVYDPQKRQVIARVNMGGPDATNLTFGGPSGDVLYTTVSKGLVRVPVGARGFSHPGAAQYTVKAMLDLVPTNTPVN